VDDGPADPRRVLIVRPSALGDVCRTVPVLASLRRRWPGARIDWLVQDAFADAIAAHPDLDEAVPFPRRALSPLARPDRLARALIWAGGLAERGYDLVLDCQGLLRSGLMTLATGAPVRVGESAARELASLCYTRTARVGPGVHTVDRMLAIARAAGAPPVADTRLHPPPEAIAGLGRLVAIDQGVPLVVIAPTSRWQAKRWPDDRFAALALSLLERTPAAIAIVGGPGERGQCPGTLALAAQSPRVHDLVGRTRVGELLALVQRAGLVVANDSAILHMAVGLGRPLVALFGPTLTHLVGPYGREADVIQHQRPDHPAAHKVADNARMMRAITVEEVLCAALERLSRCGARSRA